MVNVLKMLCAAAVNVSSVAGFLGFYVPFMYLPSLVASRDGISGKNRGFMYTCPPQPRGLQGRHIRSDHKVRKVLADFPVLDR